MLWIKHIGTAFAFLGVGIALFDLMNVGCLLAHRLTTIPLEILPTEAPIWVRCIYSAMIVGGFIARLIAVNSPYSQKEE